MTHYWLAFEGARVGASVGMIGITGTQLQLAAGVSFDGTGTVGASVGGIKGITGVGASVGHSHGAVVGAIVGIITGYPVGHITIH